MVDASERDLVDAAALRPKRDWCRLVTIFPGKRTAPLFTVLATNNFELTPTFQTPHQESAIR
jgi:hypothetical protein